MITGSISLSRLPLRDREGCTEGTGFEILARDLSGQIIGRYLLPIDSNGIANNGYLNLFRKNRNTELARKLIDAASGELELLAGELEKTILHTTLILTGKGRNNIVNIFERNDYRIGKRTRSYVMLYKIYKPDSDEDGC